MNKVCFISGIDTGCGKTMVTGLLARQLLQSGVPVITKKLVQTGSFGMAGDILEHRKIMGVGLMDEDRRKLTCPYIFRFPASPHLSARLEGKTIDCNRITETTRKLSETYDVVLLEGAGGLLVPLNDNRFTIDYLQEMNYPLILVSSSKLGSINHTLMSLEICVKRNINIKALVYNHLPGENNLIAGESRNVFKKYLAENCPGTLLVDCLVVEKTSYPLIAISGFF